MTITAKKATKEKRSRDRKRGRILLCVHGRTYHLSREEAEALAEKLSRSLSAPLRSIKSILDCKMFLVNIEDDQAGAQVALVAHVPFINRAVVVDVAKVGDMRLGQGRFRVLHSELESDFLRRISAKPSKRRRT
jgi:hypothetical protein